VNTPSVCHSTALLAGPVCLSHNRLKMCSCGANGMADKESIAFLRKQEATMHGH
jgi:hypothetical protein